MGDVRSYVAGNFYFELDGIKCGFIKSIDGGGVTADVIEEKVGPSYFTKKHIGQPKYEDFTMMIGLSMSKAIYEWIESSWKMNYQRKNGRIIACDHKLDAKSAIEFFNSLITETTLPAMDGSSKEPGYMTLKFASEYTRNVSASGKAAGELGKSLNKMFLPSNFRVTIDGLDCTKVSKVDSFTVKQNTQTDDIGDARDMLKEPGALVFPNLKFTMAEVTSESWKKWHEDFVIKGNNDESMEKSGTIELLSPNRQDVLLTVTMFNLGIFKFGTDKVEGNADAIKRCTAELYCERMELKYGGKLDA